ncbi:MAG: tetratricopeptide repeat protein [Planctomycetes bacterium]|nr:tetratricopeptide repeat protein [Planctomycetota bacterium]
MAEIDKLFTKAEEAVQKKNYGYAIDLLQQILSIKPDDVKARQTFRGVCVRRAKEQGAPSPAMAYVKGIGPLLGMFLAGVTKNFEKKIAAAQKFLVIDPDNVTVRLALGDALRNSGHIEGAIVEVECVSTVHREDIKAARMLGQLYREKGDTPKAIECYNVVSRLAPNDREAYQALKDLLAQNTMQTGGWDTAGGSRDVMKDKAGAAKLAEDHKIHKSTEETEREVAELEEKIAAAPDDPATVKTYMKLGEVLQKSGDLERALEIFEKAYELDKVNPQIRMKVGDIQIKQYQNRLAEAQTAAKTGDADAKELVKQIKGEMLQFQTEEFQRRVKEHPTDMALKFALGTYLFEGGQVDAAVGEFQQTVKDPKKKLDSLEYLGRCFMNKKMYDMSIEQFKKAIKENNSSDREKSLRYNLGVSFEKKGKLQEALDEYNHIYEVDIKYRDVPKRIEDIQGKLGGG